MSEIVVAERPPEPPLLVMMQSSMIFTADSMSGLRVWSSKNEHELIASIALVALGTNTPNLPTSMAIDSSKSDEDDQRVVVGFEDGSFTIVELRKADKAFKVLFSHAPSSNGMLSALAYCSPYLLSMTEDNLLSLYTFANDETAKETLESPEMLYSLRSHTAWPPISLSLRPNASSLSAAIAYALPTYLAGWTVGVQEMRYVPQCPNIGSVRGIKEAWNCYPKQHFGHRCF